MKTRAIAAFGGLTAAAAAAAIWLASGQGSAPADAPQGPLFPGLASRLNDVASIALSDAKQTLTVVRGADGGWTLKEKDGYPADADAVRRAAVAVADLRLLETRSKSPDAHLKMGVADVTAAGSDAISLALRGTDGKDIAALLAGKMKSTPTTSRPGELFVRRAGEAQAWLVSGRLEVKVDPVAWAAKDTLRLERPRVMSVEIVHPEGPAVRIAKPDPKAAGWDLAEIPEGKKQDGPSVAGLAGAFEYMTFDDVSRADKIDLSKAVVGTWRSFDGVVIVSRVAKIDGKAWAAFDVSFDAEQAAKAGEGVTPKPEDARKGAEEMAKRVAGWAYKLPEHRSENLLRRFEDMLAKE